MHLTSQLCRKAERCWIDRTFQAETISGHVRKGSSSLGYAEASREVSGGSFEDVRSSSVAGYRSALKVRGQCCLTSSG